MVSMTRGKEEMRGLGKGGGKRKRADEERKTQEDSEFERGSEEKARREGR